MKYELINTPTPSNSPLTQLFYNRGIPVTEVQHYLHLTDNDISSPLLLGEDKLREAVSVLKLVFGYPDSEIGVITDCDCDGYTSSAILINYLHDLNPEYTENHVSYFHHEGKQHGLQDCMEWIEDINADLVIIPDAGSNDIEQIRTLRKAGKYVIILDHHIVESEEESSSNCVLINSQLPPYPNQELSGAGVVYQFCRYLDEVYGVNYADKYLDLCALGLVGDMQSLRSCETRRLISKGIDPARITNPFIFEMWQKNKFKLGDVPTAWGFTFYIVPFVNAITRSGTLAEKELIFNSMLTFKAFKQIPSNKRGHKLGEIERLVDQAVRTCTNVKNRQGRAETEGLELVEKLIETNHMMDHKVLLFLLEPGQMKAEIRGLVANKLMAKYQRPCCILTKTTLISAPCINPITLKYEPGINKVSYQGSARGCDRVGITHFKEICDETGMCSYTAGHSGAFGLGLPAENINEFVSLTDSALVDMPNEPVYYVDYIWNPAEDIGSSILEIAQFAPYVGKDMEEPLVAIRNIEITKDNIVMMKSNTSKITLPNGVAMIKFNMSDEEFNQLYSETGAVYVDIVGICNCNTWNGVDYPQILIKDLAIKKQVAYVF